jgi:hypothetical protein
MREYKVYVNNSSKYFINDTSNILHLNYGDDYKHISYYSNSTRFGIQLYIINNKK